MAPTITPRTFGGRPIVQPPAVNVRSPWHIPAHEPRDPIAMDQVRLTLDYVPSAPSPRKDWTPALILGSMVAASLIPGAIHLAAPPPPASVGMNATRATPKDPPSTGNASGTTGAPTQTQPPATANGTTSVQQATNPRSGQPGGVQPSGAQPPSSGKLVEGQPSGAQPSSPGKPVGVQPSAARPTSPSPPSGASNGGTQQPSVAANVPHTVAAQPAVAANVPHTVAAQPAVAANLPHTPAPVVAAQPAVEAPPRIVYGPDVTAVPSVDGAVPLDGGSTWKAETTPAWRTFGHRAEGKNWFDNGKWADTQTAVTADQAASMSHTQQTALAWSSRLPVEALRLGDAGRVEVEAAVGTIDNADRLDYGRTLKAAPSSSASAREVNFGHRAVRGHLFAGSSWADSKTLVSADQVAAMPSSERTVLAKAAGVPVESLRVGDAKRATLDEAALIASQRFDVLAAHNPDRFVTSHGFRMRADTASHFQTLLKLVSKSYPGRGIRITSTVGGHHLDWHHRDGRAIDFVVEPLTQKESTHLEDLARQAGFDPFNEYIHNSPFKTGPHMHISLD